MVVSNSPGNKPYIFNISIHRSIPTFDNSSEIDQES